MTTEGTVAEKDFYRFVLYLNGQPISQTEFPAHTYNQNVRYFVNIKELAPDFIKSLQNVLSLKDKDLNLKLENYNFIKEYNKVLSINKKLISLSPELNKINRLSEGTYLDGRYVNEQEQFKFVLYLNENHIIERNFFVKNFNPKSRFSIDLIETIIEIIDDIKNHIKKQDSQYMWVNNYKPYSYSLN